MMPSLRQTGVTRFEPLPHGEPLQLAWPTESRRLETDPARYAAGTRANAQYGLPGWTRDCGKRFHRGLDIAPARPVATGATTKVLFSDCAAGTEYESAEPVLQVDEPVFAVASGSVREVNDDPVRSELGCYVVLAHRWPGSGASFFTLYAHLQTMDVRRGAQLAAGDRVGTMGQTSSSADARNWMAVAPHLHFEVWTEYGQAHDPLQFLQRWLPR